MEKCKFCQAQLEEGSTLCPSCGKDNAEAETGAQEVIAEETAEVTAEETAPVDAPAAKTEIKEGIRVSPGVIAGVIAAFVVLLAVLIAVIVMGLKDDGAASATEPTGSSEASVEETVAATVPADTGLNDATCKGTYTVSDDEVIAAADTVVATMGDAKLTNAELQVYYWMGVNGFLSENYYYLSYYGLDYTQPMDTQVCPFAEGLTWQQFFLQVAIDNWQAYQAIVLESEDAAFVMDAEAQAALDAAVDLENFEKEAQEAGFADGKAYTEYFVGKGGSVEAYMSFLRRNLTADAYYQSLYDQIAFSDEEIETYFNEHEAELAESGISKDTYTVDVRHILIMPEGATSETIRTETFPEEAWASAETEAQQILDEWLAGDKTEESFGLLANEKSDDGDGTTGGLYTDVETGMMVEAFDAWCFDAARQVGDYEIVKTEFGYHVMYFCGSTVLWPDQTKSVMISEAADKLLQDALDKHPMEVDYKSMVLGFVDMSA